MKRIYYGVIQRCDDGEGYEGYVEDFEMLTSEGEDISEIKHELIDEVNYECWIRETEDIEIPEPTSKEDIEADAGAIIFKIPVDTEYYGENVTVRELF